MDVGEKKETAQRPCDECEHKQAVQKIKKSDSPPFLFLALSVRSVTEFCTFCSLRAGQPHNKDS